jgi:hypothetical protein
VNEDLERKIRDRAYQLWEAEGQPYGRADEHWQEARRQVMDEEGLGEPGSDQPAQADDDAAAMPEPQPEVPEDPLRNPEGADPTRDPIYATGPGPEMPGATEPGPEIPYESGVSEIPAPGPGPDDTGGGGEPAASAASPAETARKRGRDAAGSKAASATGNGAAAKPRSGRSGRAKAGEATTT